MQKRCRASVEDRRLTVLCFRYEIKYGNPARPVLHGLADNLSRVFENFKTYHKDVARSRIIASVVCDLLTEMQRPLSVEETMNLTEAAVLFFYGCVVCDQGMRLWLVKRGVVH